MVDLQFSIEGDELVSRRLGIVADGVTTYRQPFEQISTNFMKVFDVNFGSRGGLYGGWAPRKPQYRDGRRVDTWPLMERTGRMRKGFMANVTDTTLELGNTQYYFKYHQSRRLPRTKLPRRVMMKIRSQEATMIVKEVQYYLVQLLRMDGRR